MPDHLLIVSGDKPRLYEALTEQFVGVSTVQIILDRRRGERRRHAQAYHTERRATERRQHVPAPRSDWFVCIPPGTLPTGSPLPEREITRLSAALARPLRAVRLVAR
jgi:hypothetical protein